MAKPNTPRTATSASTPAPPAIENRSIKLDIISGQSFYRRARLSNRLPYNKMLINVALGRTGGTGNRASGRRRGQISEVGGAKFRGREDEVRRASGEL